MKFLFNQTVVLLDTEYKPAGNAIVRDYNDEKNKYQVEYRYPGSQGSEHIWVSAERLTILIPKVEKEKDSDNNK
jgi:hypothetical protein